MTVPHGRRAWRTRNLRFVRAVLGAQAVLVLCLGAHAEPALAGTTDARSSPMTTELCASRRVPCAIRVSDQLREGAADRVHVSGRPSTSVEVQIFKLDVVGGRIVGMAPLGSSTTVDLNARGHGTGNLPIAPFDVDDEGGWALVSLADTVWHGDPARIVGQIVPIGARSPTVLGDGYGIEKPVGTVLDMEIANYIPGTRFTVEYLGDDGSWHNITIATAEHDEAHQPVMTLRYSVPNGLVTKPYRFRAHNVTDPSAVDQEWAVVPSTDALPQARAEVLVPPELGNDVTQTLVATVYSSRGVIVSTAIVGSIALGAVVVWPALAIRRRRITLESVR